MPALLSIHIIFTCKGCYADSVPSSPLSCLQKWNVAQNWLKIDPMKSSYWAHFWLIYSVMQDKCVSKNVCDNHSRQHTKWSDTIRCVTGSAGSKILRRVHDDSHIHVGPHTNIYSQSYIFVDSVQWNMAPGNAKSEIWIAVINCAYV